MSVFTLDLDEAARDRLERWRVLLGVKSHAAALRALIDQPLRAAAKVEELSAELKAGLSLPLGPPASLPGSRLKQPAKGRGSR